MTRVPRALAPVLLAGIGPVAVVAPDRVRVRLAARAARRLALASTAIARRTSLAAGTLAGAIALVLLHLWRGIEYWNYSEGVYALTSRLWVDGADLYGKMVVAQPPWQFVFGAGVLEIHDSMTFLRFGVGLAQLGAGVPGGDRRVAAHREPARHRGGPRADAADPVGGARARCAHAGAARAAVLLGAALLATRPDRRGSPARSPPRRRS